MSRLIMLGVVTISEMLLAAVVSMSSALAKACVKPSFGYISVRRSLLITNRASVYFPSSSAPRRAFRIFGIPSKKKGIVTMPTVSMPRLLTARATTGEAPVPVPPPMPAVMNTMFGLGSSRASISSMLSSAASRAISGLPPAPKPPVVLGPIRSFVGTGDIRSAWASVLSTTNSIPSGFWRYMWLTALLPPPPIPRTSMRRSRARFSESGRYLSRYVFSSSMIFCVLLD